MPSNTETSTARPTGPVHGEASCNPQEALACLLSVTRELNAAADLTSGLRRVAESLRRFLPYDNLGILLVDEQGKELHFELAVGYPPQVAKHWRFGMGQGIVGTAAATGEVVVVGDVEQDGRYIHAVEGTRSEVAIPLAVKDRTIGVLDIGSNQSDAFSAEHVRLLKFLGAHLANTIEGAHLYQSLRDQAQTLSLLHEITRELTSILDRRQLLERVAELVKRMAPYDRFTAMLWNEESRLLETWIAVERDGPRLGRADPMPLGHGISGTAGALRQPLRVANVRLDPRYVQCEPGVDTGSELAVPLVFRDRLIGVLDLERNDYGAFTVQHEQALSTLASSLAIALENARLYEKVREDEQRLKDDLETAREIQKQLLPNVSPWIPGLQVAVAYEPARQLGGDFYEFVPYGDGNLAVAVGDVAGKATSAALYGSLAVGMLREYAFQNRNEPGRVLADMNEKLKQLRIENRFLAMTYAVYQKADRVLTLANSGLPRPHLVRAGGVEEIPVEGMPLGLFGGQNYHEFRLQLEVADAVVIASDGIEESLNHAEEEFGSRRLRETLRRLADGSAQELARGLLDAVRRYSGNTDPTDDRTIVVLKLTPE